MKVFLRGPGHGGDPVAVVRRLPPARQVVQNPRQGDPRRRGRAVQHQRVVHLLQRAPAEGRVQVTFAQVHARRGPSIAAGQRAEGLEPSRDGGGEASFTSQVGGAHHVHRPRRLVAPVGPS